MAPWESGQPWEPSGYRLGAAGREPLPGPLSLGWGRLFQDWLNLLYAWLLQLGICAPACQLQQLPTQSQPVGP